MEINNITVQENKVYSVLYEYVAFNIVSAGIFDTIAVIMKEFCSFQNIAQYTYLKCDVSV